MSKFKKMVLTALVCGVAFAFFGFGTVVAGRSGGYAASTVAAADALTEIPENTKNALVLDAKDNKDGTLTLVFSVKGDVQFAGITGELKYDASLLTYSASNALCAGIVLNPMEGGRIAFSFNGPTDIVKEMDFFDATFSYSGTGTAEFALEIEEGNFSNAALEDAEYTVFGGTITFGTPEQDSSTEDSSSQTSSSTKPVQPTKPTKPAQKGCGSSISGGMFLAAAGVGGVILAKKRK